MGKIIDKAMKEQEKH